MSERRDSLTLWDVGIVLLIVFLLGWVVIEQSEIRDLQRRIGQLESTIEVR